jgi:hypothetical protein
MNEMKAAPLYSPLWKKLYLTIQEFVRAEPWQLFENEDIFIVQSPEDAQMYLCSIMGNGGEEFGLNGFRGARGMRNFFEMVTRHGDGPPPRNFPFEIDMLSFSLSPRDFMDKRDLSLTKKLMLSFSGGSWPLIRSYRPHYAPWYLSEPEITALLHCLEQTLVLYNKGEDAIDEIRDVEPGEILVRHMEHGEWVSDKVPVVYPAKEELPEIRLDDITVKRLLNLPDTDLAEEIDLGHISMPVGNHEPPYFGLALVGINEKQCAYQYGLLPPFTDYFQDACDSLAKAFLARGKKPGAVLLRDGSQFADVFEIVAGQTGINCKRCEDLPLIDDFLDTMDQAFKNGDISAKKS